jgi:hypothetical protein
MKLTLCILFLGIMVGFVGVQSAQCENMIVNGVEVDEFGLLVSTNSLSTPLDVPNSLTFDPPCGFRNALPVSKYPYKHLGFSFKGNGAVLNECSNFFVTGYSPPNFLAFNCESDPLVNGKVPSLPLKITFKPPVSSVSFRIGSSSSAGELVHATFNKKLFTWDITLANTMNQYSYTITGPTIKTLDFTVPEGSNACQVVIDDIQTTP